MEEKMGKNGQNDIDFEIQFYEGILKKRGDFLQALVALGDLYTKKGLYEKGLMIDQRLSRLKSDDPIVLYNLACSYSLVNKVDEAYEAIKRAIRCGYDDFSYLEQDSDLANLQKDSRFQRYFSKFKGKSLPPLKKKD
jgi:tetratricopeptide (TPR) repeat protein